MDAMILMINFNNAKPLLKSISLQHFMAATFDFTTFVTQAF